jgi:biotin carboxyl carrier protein
VPEMPIFQISLNGKLKQIELTRTTETSFSVRIDGKNIAVKLPSSKLETGTPFRLDIGSKTYQIEIPSIERDRPVDVKVEGTTFKAEFRSNSAKHPIQGFQTAERSLPLRSKIKPVLKQSLAEGAVVAPMTGKIASIKIKRNEIVKANQVLCVIEAMKMENEILSTIDGRVLEINVAEGSPVNEGDVLFIIA